MSKIARLIELSAIIKEAEAEAKLIKESLLANENFMAEEVVTPDKWKYKVQRITKNTSVFKEEVDKAMVISMYPECTKVEIDLDALKNNPDAHDLFELKTSSYIEVRPVK